MYEDFQKIFFERLLGRYEKKGALVTELERVLRLSKDAIYRRLRGDTALTANELILLARKFNISLDQGRTDNVPMFLHSTNFAPVESEVEYYRTLEEQMKMFINVPGVTIDYATPELPLFYEFMMPTLLAFKTYVYGVTTWNFEKWQRQPFHPGLIAPEVTEIAGRIVEGSYKFGGQELWSIGILDVTLRQIEHNVEIGMLDDEDLIEQMFAELEIVVDHLKDMANEGKRFPRGGEPNEASPDFNVYHNELTNTNNVILVNMSDMSVVFTTFMNPNYLISVDQEVCRQTKVWFNNLVENADALGKIGGKHTQVYFKRLEDNIRAAKLRIKAIKGERRVFS
jgi:transcriptional regulator with XRE-family HTH domain